MAQTAVVAERPGLLQRGALEQGVIEMKKQWTIRKAVIEDSADLQKIMESAYSAYQERMGGKRLVLLAENISLYKRLGWSEIERDDVRVYMKKEIYK